MYVSGETNIHGQAERRDRYRLLLQSKALLRISEDQKTDYFHLTGVQLLLSPRIAWRSGNAP